MFGMAEEAEAFMNYRESLVECSKPKHQVPPVAGLNEPYVQSHNAKS
jgi:hypothetical protein